MGLSFRQDRTSLIELTMALSHSLDLVSRPVVRHQQQVCFTVLHLGELLGLPPTRLQMTALAAALHDIGLLSLGDHNRCREFDDEYEKTSGCGVHAERGCHLLAEFEPLREAARIVRHHHTPWDEGRGGENDGAEVPEESHLLHLADRLNVLLDTRNPVLGQLDEAVAKVAEREGTSFKPEHVAAVRELADVEGFWLHLASPHIDQMVCRHPSMERPTLPLEELVDLSILFARAVDYRSPHTAAHSVGVGASARAITGYTGFSERERQFVQVAGRMHDIGKLCVPPELLEKEDRLTAEEERTVREHTYHTYCLLDGVQNLDTVKRWAAYHHERVNGDGYPFHMAGDSLSLGARAVAVADVFTALTESRPHRKRLASHEVRHTLGRMAHDRLLDRELAGVLIAEYDEIEGQLLDAQRAGAARYREIARKYPDMMQ